MRSSVGYCLRKSHSLVVLLLLLLAAGLFYGLCTAFSATSAPAAAKTVVRIGWIETPDNLNPYVGTQGTDFEIWTLNYDGLVGGNGTNTVLPQLATSWSVTPDGKTWTFHIRHGVTWQDGVPLTARDVAFSYNYILANNLANWTVYLTGIKRAVAVDDYTVKILCNGPKADILTDTVYIVPQHIWSKVPGKAAGTSYKVKVPLVGSGPFQTVAYEQDNYVTMVANPNFWGGRPKIDELIFQTYQNADTMVSDLRSGYLDAAVGIPRAQYAQVSKTPGITASADAYWQFVELGMNCDPSPSSKGNPVLLDERFRQALNWAVDRQKVVSLAYAGFATVGSTLIPPYSPYHWQPAADQMYSYDPAKADQLLDAAGYKMGPHGIRLDKHGKPIVLRLYATSDYSEDQIIAKLCVGWFKAVGVKAVLSVVDPGFLESAQVSSVGRQADARLRHVRLVLDDGRRSQLHGRIYTPEQIEGWNDCSGQTPTSRSSPPCRSGSSTRRSACDRAKMQQIFYNACPYIIFAYPQMLEAYNTAQVHGLDARAGQGRRGRLQLQQPRDLLYLRAAAARTSSLRRSSWLPSSASFPGVAALIDRGRWCRSARGADERRRLFVLLEPLGGERRYGRGLGGWRRELEAPAGSGGNGHEDGVAGTFVDERAQVHERTLNVLAMVGMRVDTQEGRRSSPPRAPRSTRRATSCAFLRRSSRRRCASPPGASPWELAAPAGAFR